MSSTQLFSSGKNNASDLLHARCMKMRGAAMHPDQILFTLHARFDAAKCQAAMQQMVNNHTLLRTGFKADTDSDPRSFVLHEVTAPVFVEDWRAMPDEAGRISRLESYRQLDAYRGFDYSQPPLLRVTVIRWRAGELRVIMTSPHGLLDERSRLILLEEWLATYTSNTQTADRTPDIPYGLAALFERMREDGDARFWQHYLSGNDVPVFIDRPASGSAHSFAGKAQEYEQHLDTASSGRIGSVLGKSGISLSTLAQTALACLLSRYTDTSDPVFGVFFPGRAKMLENDSGVIGPFQTVLPLKVSIAGDETVYSLIKRVQENYRQVRAHEHCSLNDVIKAAGWKAREDMFEATLECRASEAVEVFEKIGAQYGASAFEYFHESEFSLAFEVINGVQIKIRLRTHGQLWPPEFSERMLLHFTRLILECADNIDRRINEIEMLAAEERTPIRWPGLKGNTSGTSSQRLPAVIHERVERQAEACPDAIAACCDTNAISYGDLNTYANRVAEKLRESGVKRGEKVGLCVGRQLELLSGILGILKSGAAYVPLDPDYPDERLQLILHDAGVRFVLTPKALQDALPKGVFECISFEDAYEFEGVSAKAVQQTVTPDDPAYVIYTSGSTGKPKGVVVSHRNVTRLFDACYEWLTPGSNDVWSLFHSFAFDFSVWEIWGALFYGGRVEIVPYSVSRSPEQFHRLLSDRGITVLSQTPSAFQLLAQADTVAGERLDALRFVIFGGEALELSRLRAWVEKYGDAQPQLINMYGITETTVHVTYRRILTKDLDTALGSVIGWPLPDLYVRLLDREQRPVPPGVPGEICVGGAGVTLGYLNRPELNAERFISDPHSDDPAARLYRSGDYARLLPNGELAYLGRRDNEVKIRGFRIDLGEITNTLRNLPGVSDAVVTARQGVDGSKRLVAYYVSAGRSATHEAELRRRLADSLPAHMLPGVFMELPEIPLTVNNKVDLRALPEPSAQSVRDTTVSKARTPVEAVLVRVWSEVLARADISPDDDFFAMGGDSILALSVVARAREAGIEITPTQLLQHSQLSELAEAINFDTHTAAKTQTAHGNSNNKQGLLLGKESEFPGRHNWSMLFAVPGELDLDLFEQAWRVVIGQHDELQSRAQNDESGQGFISRGLAQHPMEFSRVELYHLDSSEQEEAISLIAEDIRESLNMRAGLLLRVAHFKCGGDAGDSAPDRLLLEMHEPSMGRETVHTILKEVELTYQSLADNQSPIFSEAAGADAEVTEFVHLEDEEGKRSGMRFSAAGLSEKELAAFPADLTQLEDILPLSPIQQLYYTVSGTRSDVGFDQWTFDLQGNIEPGVFREAWCELMARHDVLRTIFVDENLAEPRQAVMKNAEPAFENFDWRELDAAEQTARLKQLLADGRERGFDLSSAPLTRLSLIHTGEKSWKFVWSYHRLQIDGWSWPVLLHEFGQIYDSLLAGRSPQLPRAGSYRDYITWLARRDRARYAEFWREQLRGLDSAHLLTSGVKTANVNGLRSRRMLKSELSLSRELSRAIEQFARAHRMTPSVVFQGAWALLLAAFTGTFDATIGAAYSGRTAGIPDGEKTVGPFINDIPVRIRIQPAVSIANWIDGVRAQQAGLNEFQNASPAEIHEWSQRSHRSRLFDTLLIFQNYAVGEATTQWGRHIKVAGFRSGIATTYPLTIAITPGNQYQVDLIADDELISRETAEAVALHLIATLNLMTTNPDVRVGAVLERTPPLRTAGAAVANQLVVNRPAFNRRDAAKLHGRDQLEREIESVVREVLELDDIGMERNFFELGVQSVSLIEIHRRLQERLDKRFPIVKLFQHPSLRALASYIRAGDDATVETQAGMHRGALMRQQRRAAAARRPFR